MYRKRFLDYEIMEDFITSNFKSISDFCRKLGVSRSHFDGMMKGKIACGIKTREKLMNLLNDYEVNLEDVLEPLPLLWVKNLLRKFKSVIKMEI